MHDKKKTPVMTWVHLAIGLSIMILFPMLPPVSTITPVGMKVMGAFVGMVYLWSTMDMIWPSMLGLLLIALSGYTGDVTGYAAIKMVMKEAFGSDTMVALTFAMILFGGIEYVGCTQYFIRFFVTRKVINGRPFALYFMILLSSYMLAGLTNPVASLLILWPISTELLMEFGYKKGDKAFYSLIIGVLVSAALGQPMFPFKGAAMIVVGAYENLSQTTVPVLQYIAYNLIMSILILSTYIGFLKFVLKPDMSALKNVTTEQFEKNKLPPMNFKQKSFMITMAVYIIVMILPCVLPKTFGIVKIINRIGVIGVNMICIIVLMILKDEGEAVLDFRAIARKSFNWNTYLLVAAAVFGANAISAEITGIKPFLIQSLQPLLGNKPELVFIFLILAFALITTNFANNAGMAVVLLPVIIAFAEQYPGVPTMALSMSVTMMVFVAFLTPAASPWAGMMFGRKDIINAKEILIIGFPVCISALLFYVIIGFPLAKFLFK